MVISTQELMNKYKNYKVPKMKIKSEVDSGKYFLIKKGLYETDDKVPGHFLAQFIKSPSYLSFEYALSFYGLIPELVNEYTCATVKQRHSFMFHNQFGRYSYRDVPDSVFFVETKWIKEGTYSYCIATKEKALCDYLYTVQPLLSKKKLFSYLFNSMRLDSDEFMTLDFEKTIELSKLYKTTNHKLLISLLEDFKNGKYLDR